MPETPEPQSEAGHERCGSQVENLQDRPLRFTKDANRIVGSVNRIGPMSAVVVIQIIIVLRVHWTGNAHRCKFGSMIRLLELAIPVIHIWDKSKFHPFGKLQTHLER